MKNERILPYKTSQKLGEEVLKEMLSAGMTSSQSGGFTYSPQNGCDGNIDAHSDG